MIDKINTIKWLFIDFDNTMMGTEQHAIPSLIARFNELYGTKIGRGLSFDEFKKHFHGQAREFLCKNLSEYFDYPIDYSELYQDREWQILQHLQKVPGGVPMAPYLIETLKKLTEKGIQPVFVSNNPIQRALAAMRFADNGRGAELAGIFGTFFFEAGDVPKPNPEVYLRAMAQVGAKTQESIAIEDSRTGVASAVAAKIRTLGYVGFSNNSAELRKILIATGASQILNDWRELFELLG